LQQKQFATKKQQTEEDREMNKEQMQHLILSGRNEYLALQQNYFAQSPWMQKLFGMGYGGNYPKTPKLIEMDFHDLFFSFGIVGFFVYIAPLIYVLVHIGCRLFRNIHTFIDLEFILISSGIALELGIALTAGHVLTAPAVSIYLAVLIAYLFIRTKNISYKTAREKGNDGGQ
jgi:O-antigen ligase like membrane protein